MLNGSGGRRRWWLGCAGCGGRRWRWPVAGGGGRRRWPVVAVAGGRLPEVVVVAEGHFCHLEGIHRRNDEIHHFWEGMVKSIN